jgi:hypothetical protein
MKKLLLVLALVAGVSSSRADTYNIGEANSFYVGFYAHEDVSSDSVIFNLGRSADVFAGISLNQPELGTVLSSTFGSDWYTNPSVYMGAFGYNGIKSATGNLFVGLESGQPLLQNSMESTTLTRGDNNTYKDGIGAVMASHTSGASVRGYVTGSTGHLHQFSIMDNSETSFNGMSDVGWNIFSTAVYAQVTSLLSVQEFAYNGSGFATVSSGPSTTVQIQTSGGSVSVVPEPSTYALMGIAMLFLVVAYRRKTA